MKIDLLPKVAIGDQRAAHAMIHRYGHRIWTIALRLLYKESHAAIATRMIFVLLRRHARRYQPESMSELLFVTIVARRYCLNYRKMSKSIEFSQQNVENSAKTWRWELCKESVVILRRLSQVPNVERRLMTYLLLEKEQSLKQLALRCNLSLEDIQHILANGLKSLKNCLPKYPPEVCLKEGKIAP